MGLLKRLYPTALMTLAIVVVSSGQSFKGRVLNALDTTAIRGAVVSIGEIQSICTTTTKGAFEFPTLGKGAYGVRVVAEGFIGVSKRIVLSSPQEVGVADLEFDFRLYRERSAPDTSSASVTVQYFFRSRGNVEITISDIAGNKIRREIDRSREGGMRTYSWDGKDDKKQTMTSGTYTVQISSGGQTMVRKLRWEGEQQQ